MHYLSLPLSLILIFATTTHFLVVTSQQPYDPSVCGLNSTTALGYACNGLKRHCRTYLIFRTHPPYTNSSAVASLFGSDPSRIARLNNVSESSSLVTGKEMIVPVNCSCSGRHYQSNVTYVVRAHDSPYMIANVTFEGLTTCRAIQGQRSGLVEDIFPPERLTIPIRCACPTRNQSRAGIKYLMSYVIKSGDTISTVGVRFGADVGETLQANKKSVQDYIIQPFTTLLVPLRSPPNSTMTVTPHPVSESPSPPPPPPPSASVPTSSEQGKWNYFLYGLIAGSGFVLIFGAFGFSIVMARKRRRRRQVVTVKSSGDDANKASIEPVELLESISKVAQSLKVFSFKDLQIATDDFSSSARIGGSVYRGELSGQQVAIRRTESDVSREIEILNKINHTNIITLIGVCYSSGLWYLVYEYATNGRLSDWIFSGGNNTLGWDRRVQIAHDVATGLDYLHRYTTPPHVHAHFKCSYVLLDSELRAKITHLGLSRAVVGAGERLPFALTHHIVGTKGYMAPEYLEHGLVTTKMDVYAFGIFVVEILTGKEAGLVCGGGGDCVSLTRVLEPLIADGNDDKLTEFLDPSLQDKWPLDVGLTLLRLAHRCVSKEPSERPGMDDVASLLSKALTCSVVSGTTSVSTVSSSRVAIDSDH